MCDFLINEKACISGDYLTVFQESTNSRQSRSAEYCVTPSIKFDLCEKLWKWLTNIDFGVWLKKGVSWSFCDMVAQSWIRWRHLAKVIADCDVILEQGKLSLHCKDSLHYLVYVFLFIFLPKMRSFYGIWGKFFPNSEEVPQRRQN